MSIVRKLANYSPYTGNTIVIKDTMFYYYDIILLNNLIRYIDLKNGLQNFHVMFHMYSISFYYNKKMIGITLNGKIDVDS